MGGKNPSELVLDQVHLTQPRCHVGGRGTHPVILPTCRVRGLVVTRGFRVLLRSERRWKSSYYGKRYNRIYLDQCLEVSIGVGSPSYPSKKGI